jgi:hypothetical protein
MEKETLKNIMYFLEREENKSSFKWKLLNDEPFTEGELNIKGDLNLNSLAIESLPEGLKVGGSLTLSFSKITSLPKGLQVDGNLYLTSATIESLPEGLKVGGNLELSFSKMTSLPKGLKVYGDLNIFYTKLGKYTDEQLREMVKPGFIQGKINNGKRNNKEDI